MTAWQGNKLGKKIFQQIFN